MNSSFRLAFGIGIDAIDRDTVAAVAAAGTVDPHYLVSCEALTLAGGGPDLIHPHELPFPTSIRDNRLLLDSGGYSILSGARPMATLPPTAVARFYNQLGDNLCIGTDAPLYCCPMSYTWKVTKHRLDAFYRVLEPSGRRIYNVIHGHYRDVDDTFTLRFRAAWYHRLLDHFGDRTQGYALRFADETPQAQAFFAMQPWSVGEHDVHLLALGGITYLPLAVYLGRFVYNNLTADAKSHTIDATGRMNLKLMQPNDFRVPSGTYIGRGRLDPTQLKDACQCPVCLHLEDQFETTILRLAESNARGLTLEGDKLRVWIRAHNILVVERYIEQLKVLVEDRQNFLQFLREGRIFKGTLKSIETVDRLLEAGPHAYAQNIALADPN